MDAGQGIDRLAGSAADIIADPGIHRLAEVALIAWGGLQLLGSIALAAVIGFVIWRSIILAFRRS
jgi:hypothetical protein